MSKRKYPEKLCVVCDGHQREHRHQTCGRPECGAILALHPELRDPERWEAGSTKFDGSKHKRLSHDVEGITQAMGPVNTIFEAAEVVGKVTISAAFEQRLAEIPSAARIDLVEVDPQNPWSRGSRLVVAVYLEADRVGLPGAAMTIELPKRHRVAEWIRESLMGGTTDDPWDIFIAWRCACPYSHRVIYRKPEDIPQALGYHDACPRCNHAPVEVVRPHA